MCHSGAGTAYPSLAPEFIPVFSGVRIGRSLVFSVLLIFIILITVFFSFWPLYCLSFFDLRFLITHFGIFKLVLQITVHFMYEDAYVIQFHEIHFVGDLWQARLFSDVTPAFPRYNNTLTLSHFRRLQRNQ